MENNAKISSTIKLNNGLEMPRVGLGTYAIENIGDIVYQSIKDGVRHIDTAFVYENEDVIGASINRAINDGLVKREDLFIVTKLPISHKHKVEETIKNQLKTLNLSYVDLYLDHWPFSTYAEQMNGQGELHHIPTHKLWEQMESLVEKGYTKSIGVSNYNVQLLMDLLTYAKIKPVVNQVEFNPYLAQQNLHKFCHDNGVYITAYNSICKGKYVGTYHKNKAEELNLLKEKSIVDLAEKYKTGPGQIALNWALAQDVIVIPSTANPNRMKENLTALNFKLTKEEIAKLNELDINYRFNPSNQYGFSRNIDIFA